TIFPYTTLFRSKRLDGRIEMVDGDAEPYVQAEKLVDSLQLLRDERRDGGIRRFAGRICEANVRRLEGFVLVLLDIPSPKEIEHGLEVQRVLPIRGSLLSEATNVRKLVDV